MIAILRYATLKTLRDRSLIAFIMMPTLLPVAALSGVTLAKGEWHYPFFMDPRFTPVQSATLMGEIVMAAAIIFASIATFWTFRPEISTRSIGAFVFAARPLTIAATLIAFGAAIGIAGWVGGTVVTAALTSALPPNLSIVALRAVLAVLAASAAGALVVTISPQPAMIIGSYLGSLIAVPLVLKIAGAPMQIVAALIVTSGCTLLSAFFLERRCVA